MQYFEQRLAQLGESPPPPTSKQLHWSQRTRSTLGLAFSDIRCAYEFVANIWIWYIIHMHLKNYVSPNENSYSAI
jgi:hypothetical protein